MAARLPPSPRLARARDACTATTTNLHHSVGPMDRKMPPESSPSPEYPHGLAYAREFRVKARGRRRRSPGKERKTRENHVKPGKQRSVDRGLGDEGGGDRTNVPGMADLKFQNFPDNVPRSRRRRHPSRDTRLVHEIRALEHRAVSPIVLLRWIRPERSLLVKSPAKRNDSRAEIFIAASSSVERERETASSFFVRDQVLSRWLEVWMARWLLGYATQRYTYTYIDGNTFVVIMLLSIEATRMKMKCVVCRMEIYIYIRIVSPIYICFRK